MDILSKLRTETSTLHEIAERQGESSKIIDHSIDEKTYQELLRQNYVAYNVIENAIDKKKPHEILDTLDLLPKISNWITSDLDHEPPISHEQLVKFEDAMEALGGLYVITGSLLGGSVLAKHLTKCPSIPQKKYHFHSMDTQEKIARWQFFKKVVSAKTFTEKEKTAAVNGAKKTFQLFISVFNQKIPNA